MQILIQYVWDETSGSAFLTSSQWMQGQILRSKILRNKMVATSKQMVIGQAS